jgi:tetratricopeptide (TPR) repeat protein
MKRCPYCGAKNKDAFEYCVRCSETLADTPPVPVTVGSFVPAILGLAGLAVVGLVIWTAVRQSPAPPAPQRASAPEPLPAPPSAARELEANVVQSAYRLGVEAYNRGEYQVAIRYFAEFVGGAPQNHFAHMYLGLAYYYSQEPEQALSAMEQAFELEPGSPDITFYLSALLKQRGNLEAAERVVRRYLEVRPNDVTAQLELGRLMRHQGKTGQSIEEAQRLAAADPQSREAAVELGESLKAAGRLNEAADAFRRAAEIDPNYAPPRHALGVTELLAKRYKEALPPLKKAVELDPENAAFRLSLAQAYESLDRIAESLDEYDAFVRLAPDDPRAPQIKGLVKRARSALAERRAQQSRSPGGNSP